MPCKTLPDEASTADGGACLTLNGERPRCVGGAVLSHPEAFTDGARRGLDRTC